MLGTEWGGGTPRENAIDDTVQAWVLQFVPQGCTGAPDEVPILQSRATATRGTLLLATNDSRRASHHGSDRDFGDFVRIPTHPEDLHARASGSLEADREGRARQGRDFHMPALACRSCQPYLILYSMSLPSSKQSLCEDVNKSRAYQPDGAAPVSSTNKLISTGQAFLPTGDGMVDYSAPRALETDEIPLLRSNSVSQLAIASKQVLTELKSTEPTAI